MKRGKCVKCGSTNVRRGPPPKGWNDASNAVPLGTVFGRQALLQSYICTACGYVEQYVYREADREKVRKKWKLAGERDD